MPALTMRGRYIMREYWGDSDLFLRLTPQEREVYVGLWMLADDAGWMPRDVPAIAAALYRYEDRAPRESLVSDVLTKLRDMGKIEGHRCCIYLPSVERYPRAGKKSEEHRLEHEKHSNRSNGIQTHSNPSPVPSLPDPSLPVVAPAPEPKGTGGAGSLKDLVGWQPPADVARRAS